jgi:Protein of unknown function (DUF3485)
MWRVGIGLAAAIILLTNGFLEGLCTNRWHRPVELETAISRLKRVPMTIGEWRAQSEELDEATLILAGVEGYFCRHYENQPNGKKVTVLLMCGRSGPLSVHTPDACYRGAGYHQDGPIDRWPQKYGNGLASAQFSRAKFSKDDATDGTSVRIEWSWGADGKWLAPTAPRATFARLPALYKLYIVQRETPSSERSNEEVCKSFLEQLLPALDNALYATE